VLGQLAHPDNTGLGHGHGGRQRASEGRGGSVILTSQSRQKPSSELQKPQSHNFLRFAAKPRSIGDPAVRLSQFAQQTSLFATENSLFDMQGVRPNDLAFQGVERQGRRVSSEIPCIFPEIRKYSSRGRVRLIGVSVIASEPAQLSQ
jgi:hypothetical protein